MFNKRHRRFHLIVLLLIISLFILFFISMNTGYIHISTADIIKALTGNGTQKELLILIDFRMMRILLAMLVGAGLAVSGNIFQTISKNGLASPSLLGINAGAGFAVMLFTFFAPDNKSFGIFILPFISLVGAMTTALLIYSLASEKGQPIAPVRLVLIGISISAGINALELVLTVRMTPEKFNSVNTWLIGSVYGSSWKHVLALLPWILIIIPFFIYSAKRLNLLRLSDGVAIGLGSNLSRERLLYLTLAVALSAASVAVGGAIGFVGLICPHLARKLVGPNHQYSIPVSALIGAVLLIASDLVARSIIAPREILLGIVVSVIGAPYFLYLLIVSKS